MRWNLHETWVRGALARKSSIASLVQPSLAKIHWCPRSNTGLYIWDTGVIVSLRNNPFLFAGLIVSSTSMQDLEFLLIT